jgi:flagellar biosynthesis protein FlhG
MNAEQQAAKILSVGGGKGGVGKSILSIALATALAREGSRVALVDLDLGAANLHTYLGVRDRTRTIADFLLNRTPSLPDLIVETPEKNLGLICGAEFVPGATSPAHWMKLKLMRHLKALPADYVVLDLGAGVQFNTLDFFDMSDHGIVITAPEPGAVMNAYSFIKGALYRRMQNIFRRHSGVSRSIDAEVKNADGDNRLTLDWFKETISRVEPDLLPLIDEIEQDFSPVLIINRVPHGQTHLLVKNLITLCKEKLGVTLQHAGDLPDVREISNHLLNVTRFFDLAEGRPYFEETVKIVGRILRPASPEEGAPTKAYDFSDEDRDEILRLMDSLDERVFNEVNRNLWKFRMFFKPSDVIGFLISRGVTHPLFYSRKNT